MDDAPVGPSTEEEAVFLVEERANGYAPAVAAQPVVEEEKKSELPPLEDLVKRIPMPARDLMEELFRAKFITVRRIPKSALK